MPVRTNRHTKPAEQANTELLPVSPQSGAQKPTKNSPAGQQPTGQPTGRELVPARRSQLEVDAEQERTAYREGFEVGEHYVAGPPASVTPLFDEARYLEIREYRLSPLTSPEGGDV